LLFIIHFIFICLLFIISIYYYLLFIVFFISIYLLFLFILLSIIYYYLLNRKTENSTLSEILLPENFSPKLCTCDYLWEGNQNANFSANQFS